MINKEVALKYGVAPIYETDKEVVFWGYNLTQNTETSLSLILNKKITLIEKTEDEVNLKIEEIYPSNVSSIDRIIEVFDKVESKDNRNNENETNSVARLLELIIENAVIQNCSDIHIDYLENCVKIRFRKDGSLFEFKTIGKVLAKNIINRIKVLSDIDYTIKNTPQDGRFSYIHKNRDVDIRVAVIPTIFGEKVVLRILNKQHLDFTPSGIGLKNDNLDKVLKLISQPRGLILTVGATGSGKSSTNYTLLKLLNKKDINIMTIEDPVEYKIDGISQVEINENSGLDFNIGLRSLLRLDPDKIMVGEIRDIETAKIALRSSITGHLVLSTLHTNDSCEAIYRLLDMGIEPYLISAGVIGIIAQRLVRKLCDCKKEVDMYVDLYDENMKVCTPCGCNKCVNGYSGRVAVFEVLILTETLRELISKGASISEFRKEAKKEGLITLKTSLKNLLLNGTISIEEVYNSIMTIGEI